MIQTFSLLETRFLRCRYMDPDPTREGQLCSLPYDSGHSACECLGFCDAGICVPFIPGKDNSSTFESKLLSGNYANIVLCSVIELHMSHANFKTLPCALSEPCLWNNFLISMLKPGFRGRNIVKWLPNCHSLGQKPEQWAFRLGFEMNLNRSILYKKYVFFWSFAYKYKIKSDYPHQQFICNKMKGYIGW